MVKRILYLVFVAMLLAGLVLPAIAVYRTGEYVRDETGSIPYEVRKRYDQHAKNLSEILYVDIIYVRTAEEDIATYAQGLHLGDKYDQIMLIENETDCRVYFFGKAQVLSAEDAQWLLEVYNTESDITVALNAYIDVAWSLVMESASGCAFDRIPEEYLEKMPLLVDDAGLLKSGEKRVLLNKLDEISQRQGVDVLLVTQRYIDGDDPWSFVSDFYENHTFGTDNGKNAIVFLVCKNECWMFTFGAAETSVTEDGHRHIVKKVMKEMKKGECAQAFMKYADLCDAFLTQAKSGQPYDGRHMPKEPFWFPLALTISLIVGVLGGIAAILPQIKQLRSVRFQPGAEEYHDAAQWKVTEDKEIYLYSTTEKRART